MNCCRIISKLAFASLLALVLVASSGVARGARLFTGCGSHINEILQDHYGYIWLATDNGLSRYDGSNIKTFTRTETPSLLSNMVLSLFEDSDNVLWVGTSAGIQKFVRETESFETPRLSYPGIPDFTYVNSIMEDSKGNLWFTTSRSGLVSFRAKDRSPVCYLTTNSSICSDKTTVVFEDKFGNIWVGSNDSGITMFNPANKSMVNFHADPSRPDGLSGNMVYSIAQSNDGDLYVASLDGGIDRYSYRTHKFTKNFIPSVGKVFTIENNEEENAIYIGTDGNGLHKYDVATGHLSRPDPDVREFDFNRCKVHDILKDSQGNVWLAVYQKGALILPARQSGVDNLGYNPFNESRNIGNEPVLSIMRDGAGNLWVGTDGDGIYLKESGGSMRHISGAGNPSIVMCLTEDSRGDVWAGAYLGGLYKCARGTTNFRNVRIEDAGGAPATVNVIAEDPQGNIWVGTNGNGIYVLGPAGNVERHLVHTMGKKADSQICGNTIHSIIFDRNGNVWIGTSDAGVSMLHSNTGKYWQFNLTNRQLNNNYVYSIVEDRTGNIWVSTATGLVCISNGNSEFLNMSNGIPEASILGMVLDVNGNLWFSNERGISCLDIKEKRVVKHFSPSGIGCREFKRGTAFTDHDGMIYFGGVGGTVSFLPSALNNIQKPGNLRINEITLPASNSDTNATVIPLVDNRKITLDYKNNTFTVNFGNFEFISPEDVVYSVLLENYSDKWIVLPEGTQSAFFSEIPPGKYTIRIKATTGDVESETTLPLEIAPPPYQTTTAMVGYLLFFLLLLAFGAWLVRKNNLNRLEHRRLLQEERIKEEKLQFFTDISHEVRTPLTLILGPIASLKKTVTDKKILNTFEMMESNGQRILRMIDQVIDLRKFDNESMRLQVSRTDIREFLGTLCKSFANIIAAKGISFSLGFTDEVPAYVLIDRDKIDKVVFNVLANAMRFTPPGGKVEVAVDIDGNSDLRIRISDTGPGIPADAREAIFERFYQVRSEINTGGTGIGLHLSRKMMEAHFGNIFVEESGDTGTTFAIIIPVDEARYSSSAIAEEKAIEEKAPVRLDVTTDAGSFEISGLSKPHTVLIIEDDVAIIEYIRGQLSKQFNVISATDGAAGLEAVVRHRPHCVITDIMLDGIDGLEICRRIRSNGETCDIPVIILTAKASEEERIKGIESGADSYITKPFNMDHLLTRISMLIHSRRVMKEKFSNSEPVNESVVGMKTVDEKLLARLQKVVVEEISNPELTVQYIADKLGVSRSHLHRRLKELINTNPVAYIKQYRMKHALILLSEKGMSVSEVAFATGFNSLSHFSSVFKEYYGMSPTKFILLNDVRDKSEN